MEGTLFAQTYESSAASSADPWRWVATTRRAALAVSRPHRRRNLARLAGHRSGSRPPHPDGSSEDDGARRARPAARPIHDSGRHVAGGESCSGGHATLGGCTMSPGFSWTASAPLRLAQLIARWLSREADICSPCRSKRTYVCNVSRARSGAPRFCRFFGCSAGRLGNPKLFAAK